MKLWHEIVLSNDVDELIPAFNNNVLLYDQSHP